MNIRRSEDIPETADPLEREPTDRNVRCLLNYMGGKGAMVPFILPIVYRIPHVQYIEPFGGGAALLLAKRPSAIEIYNDADSAIVNLFRVIRDPDRFDRFKFLCENTPYSREEFNNFRDTWRNVEDPVDRAHQFFLHLRMSFGGTGTSYGMQLSPKRKGPDAVKGIISQLEEVRDRIRDVYVENRDFRDIFTLYDSPTSLFLADPPYVPDTRRGGKYTHELTVADHQELVAILLRLQGKAILCGYNHPVYDVLVDHGWLRRSVGITCSLAGRTRVSGLQGEGRVSEQQQREESVWISPGAERSPRTLLG